MTRLAALLVACLLSGLASAQDVLTDYMPGTDFTMGAIAPVSEWTGLQKPNSSKVEAGGGSIIEGI